jgi:hypothetical protein
VICLVPQVAVPDKPKASVDPRLSVRLAVRKALEGGDAKCILAPVLSRHPALVDAILEDLRIKDPTGVARLRERLGLAQNPWADVVERITQLDENVVEPAERLRLAATLLIGDCEGLPPSVMALCHQPSSAALVAAMHAVAHAGPQRRALEGHLLRLERGGLHGEPGFLLNRQDSAFHEGYLQGDTLVMIYREYPGVFTIFAMQLGVGVEEVIVRPAQGEASLRRLLSQSEAGTRDHRSLEECRTEIAACIARLVDQPASQAWMALGHLIEERLFNTSAEGHGGFVVGESDARILVDRMARVLMNKDERLLDEMVAPHSRADVALDLFGTQYLRHLLGLAYGVSRVEISVEEIGEGKAIGTVVGRTDTGQVMTRTRLSLVQGGEGWLLSDMHLAGVGVEDKVYRKVWERLTPAFPLPFRNYDELSQVEQELSAGLMDEGFRLDEVASAVKLARDCDAEEGVGEQAAALHAAYEHCNGLASSLRHLCDRYDADPVRTATLFEGFKVRLELSPQDRRYCVSE